MRYILLTTYVYFKRDSLPWLTTYLQERFQQLRKEYPGHRLLIVSNTAGATTYDRDSRLAKDLETGTGVSVLAHRVKKPGCKDEIMAYFKKHPETGVTHPCQVVVIGDRLMTDMMLANMMGSWGIWIKDGVQPLSQKSIVSHKHHPLSQVSENSSLMYTSSPNSSNVLGRC